MTPKGMWQHLKRFRFSSMLFKDFILIFTLSAIIFLVMTLSFYSFYSNLTMDVMSVSNLNALARARDFVDLISKEAERISIRISNDSAVKQFLKEENMDTMSFEITEKVDAVRHILSIYSIANDNLYTAELYSFHNDYFISSNGISGKWSRTGNSLPPLPEDKKMWVQVIQEENTDNHVLVYFKKLHLNSPRTVDGLVAVKIDLEAFGRQIQNSTSKNYEDIFLIDDNNIILYGTPQDTIGKKTDHVTLLKQHELEPHENVLKFADRDLFVTEVESVYKKWSLVSFAVSEQYYDMEKEYLKILLIVSVVLSLIIAGLGAWWISSRMFKPINTLLELIWEKRTSENKPRKRQSAELEIIIGEILNNYEQNNQMKQQLISKQIMLNQAQNIALQAQINPHFLYNTLENINWRALALTKGKNEVSDMLVMLSRLLRFYLKTEKTIISIKDELSYARLYMDILQMRFVNAYKVIWDVDERLYDLKIVKMTLQPILENAVTHGAAKGEGGDFVKIKGYIAEDCGVIEVINSGPPLTEKQINDMNLEMEKEEDSIKENAAIGVSNVNRRIKLHFDKRYGLRASLTNEGNTCISITFPGE